MRINVVATFDKGERSPQAKVDDLVKLVQAAMGTCKLTGNKIIMDGNSGQIKRLTFEVDQSG